MAYADSTFRNAKPKDKPYKLTDEQGMYLLIQPSGKRHWRFQYRFAGKINTLSFGAYPEISLVDARQKREDARKLLAEDTDPGHLRKQTKQELHLKHEHTFELIAREWHERRTDTLNPRHAQYIVNRLEAYVFPFIGNMPITKINAVNLLSILRKIEKRGNLETAHRILQTCGQVFRYAIVTGRAERDISADLKGSLKTNTTKHRAYLKDTELPEFFQKLETYDGLHLTRQAIQLLAMTFVRTTELRKATWDEINWVTGMWSIPAVRMKMSKPHIIPLSRQAISILKDLESRRAEENRFIFQNHINPEKCMSENTILYALYRMGYHSRATGHGFRATASTILNELGLRSDLIELQLAHREKNEVRAAYNHAQYLPERSKMMQLWSDYLDAAKEGITVVDFRKQTFPETEVTHAQLLAS